MGPPLRVGGHLLGGSTAMRATSVALLQGSSLRFGLCCPEPSTLTRPHPPHSRAQHNFIARRLICAAFAVRERLGDPRVVPGFCCTSLPDMPSSTTPGSSTSISSRAVPEQQQFSTGLTHLQRMKRCATLFR